LFGSSSFDLKRDSDSTVRRLRLSVVSLLPSRTLRVQEDERRDVREIAMEGQE
jgi:hypothetical protein